MKNFSLWLYIFGAVLIAVSANSVSAVWARGDNKFSLWLILVLAISPMVFISFGLVTSKIGLAISSGVIDSLLTFFTIIVGLFFFQEWNKVSLLQCLGMVLAVCGIFLMLFTRKEGL